MKRSTFNKMLKKATDKYAFTNSYSPSSEKYAQYRKELDEAPSSIEADEESKANLERYKALTEQRRKEADALANRNAFGIENAYRLTNPGRQYNPQAIDNSMNSMKLYEQYLADIESNPLKKAAQVEKANKENENRMSGIESSIKGTDNPKVTKARENLSALDDNTYDRIMNAVKLQNNGNVVSLVGNLTGGVEKEFSKIQADKGWDDNTLIDYINDAYTVYDYDRDTHISYQDEVDYRNYKLGQLNDDEKQAVSNYVNYARKQSDDLAREGIASTYQPNDASSRLFLNSEEGRVLKENGWNAKKLTEYGLYQERVNNESAQEEANKKFEVEPKSSFFSKAKAFVKADAQTLASTANSLLTSPATMASKALGLDANKPTGFGQDINNENWRSNNITTYAQQQVSQNAIGNNHPVAQWAYDTRNSMVKSGETMLGAVALTAMGLPEGVASLLTLTPYYTETYSSSYSDLRQRGASDKEANSVAGVEAAAEVLTELVSVDAMMDMKIPENFNQLLVEGIKQAIPEASEEITSGIIGTIADYSVLNQKGLDKIHTDAKAIQESKHVSEEQAYKEALKGTLTDILMQGVSGAVSGGLMGLGNSAIHVASGVHTYNNTVNGIRNNFNEDLMNQDYTSYSEELSQKYASNPNRYIADNINDATAKGKENKQMAQQLSDKVDSGKKLSIKDKYNMVSAINFSESSNSAMDARSKYFQNVAEISKAPTEYRGQKTNLSYDDGYSQMHEAAMKGDVARMNEVKSNMLNSQSVEASNMASETYDNFRGMAMEHGASEESLNANSVTRSQAYVEGFKENNSINVEAMSDANKAAYTEGQMAKAEYDKQTKELSSDNVKKTKAETKNGEMITLTGEIDNDGNFLTIEGNRIKAEDVAWDDSATLQAYHNASMMNTIEESRAYLNNIPSKTNINSYNIAYNKFMDGGKQGATFESLVENSKTMVDAYGVDRLKNIYNVGVSIETDKVLTERTNVAANLIGYKGNAQFTGEDVAQEHGIDTTLLRMLSKAADVNINLVESMGYVKGFEQQASYESAKQTITLSVKHANQVIHEFGHFIEDYNKEGYDSLRKDLMAIAPTVFGEEDFHDYVTEFNKAYKKATGKSSVGSVSREMTNDILVAVMSTEKGRNAFINYLTGSYEVAEAERKATSIKDLFKKLSSSIRGILKGESLSKMQKKAYDKTADMLEEYADRFIKEFDKAIQNKKAIEYENKVNEVVNKVGVEYDAETESANPGEFSLDTWNASEYVKQREQAVKELSKALKVDDKVAERYIDNINSIARIIAEDKVRLDYDADPFGSAVVSNAEYGASIDFSTICKKRLLYTGTLQAIQKQIGNRVITMEDYLDIRNAMLEDNLETTCGCCYVEGSRVKMGQFMKEFIKRYSKDNPSYIPNMYDVTMPDGIRALRAKHPEVYDAREKFLNNRGVLHEGESNLFGSQGRPKDYSERTSYKGEILNMFKGKSDAVKDKNRNGGLRLQSFSDFEIVNLIDCMQVITDMSRVGLAGQAYTKVKEFADALGNTGLKINLSLIAKGVDANGNLILDEINGMKYADATYLRDKYSKNVGTIIVCFTDEQIKAAMASDYVDFIIPFHRSQWRKSQYGILGLPENTKDYTRHQNERITTEKGTLKKAPDGNIMPNTYWNFKKSGRQNAEHYIDMCNKEGKTPKFPFLLEKVGNKYVLPEGKVADGYFKLLIDFKMYDNEGVGSPQMPVVPNFSMEEAAKMLEDYTGGHDSFPVNQKIADEFTEKIKARGKEFSVDKTYSLDVDMIKHYKEVDKTKNFNNKNFSLNVDTEVLDKEYMDAIENVDGMKARKIIEEAAMRNGYYPVTRYHQTAAEFTEFNTDNPVAALNDSETPNGIFFKDNNHDIGLGGSIQMGVYLKTKNMLHFENREEANEWYCKHIEGYKQLQVEMNKGISEKFEPRFKEIENEQFNSDTTEERYEELDAIETDLISELGEFENGYRKRLRDMLDDYFLKHENEYDGIELDYDGHRWVNGKRENVHTYIVFNPKQIKSAELVTRDDNGKIIPPSERFNDKKKDIRYSLNMDDFMEEFLFGDKSDESYSSSGSILEEGMKALKNQKVDEKSISKIATNIIRDYSSKADINQLKDSLKQVFAYMQSGDYVNYDDMMRVMEEIARPVIDQSTRVEGKEEWDAFKNAMKGYKISLTDTQMKEVKNNMSYAEFKKLAYPLTITQNGTPLDSLWDEMVQASGFTLDAEAYEGDMPMALLDTISAMRPTVENNFGGDARDVSRDLAMRIVEDYFLSQGTQNLSKAKQEAVKKATSDLRSKHKEYVSNLRAAYTDRLNQARKEVRANDRWREAERRTKDAEKFAKELAKNKQRYADAKERRAVYDAKKKVSNNAKDLHKWLQTPTEKKHIPTGMVKPLMDFLSAIDFVEPDVKVINGKYVVRVFDHSFIDENGQRQMKYITIKEDTLEAALKKYHELIGDGKGSSMVKSWSEKMRKLSDLYNKVSSGTFDFPDGDMNNFVANLSDEIADEFSALLGNDKVNINQLNSRELNILNKVLQNVKHVINMQNKLITQDTTSDELARALYEEAEKFDDPKAKSRALSKIRETFRFDMLTPKVYMTLLGNAGDKVYASIRKGFNKQIRNIMNAAAYMEEIKGDLKDSDIKDWTKRVHTFDVVDGEISLTETQIMSLYETMKREGATDRIKGGILSEARTETRHGITMDVPKGKAVHVTAADIANICSVLSDEQKAMADKMQNYMATVCTELGNEVSEKLYGYRKYDEEHYFPYSVDNSNTRTSDKQVANASLHGAERPGFSNSLIPEAKNPLVMRDIFNVFTDHVSEMATYNGLAPALKDALRFFNYKTVDFDGENYNYSNVKDAINKVCGANKSEGTRYFTNLLLDLNHAQSSNYVGGITEKLIGNYKAAAVGGNARVVAQQPGAVLRALYKIKPSSLAYAFAHPIKSQKNRKVANKVSETMWWKSQGYFETAVGKSLKEIVTGVDTFGEKVKNLAMAPAGIADDITWGFLYTACEYEVLKENPSKSADEMREAINEKFDDMIDSTQVIDSTLHRSQYMRSDDNLNKIQTAFMSEPTKNYNMLLEASLKSIREKNPSKIAKALTAFITSQALTSALAAVVDMIRKTGDDDEPEEVYLENFLNNFWDNVAPWGMIPILKDAVPYLISTLKGEYTSTGTNRMDLQGIEQIINVVGDMKDVATGNSKLTPYGVILDAEKALSQATGIPLYNITRDVVGLRNMFFENLQTKVVSNPYTSLMSSIDEGKNVDKITAHVGRVVRDGGSVEEIQNRIRNKYRKDYLSSISSDPDLKKEIYEKAINGYIATGMTKAEAEETINNWIVEDAEEKEKAKASAEKKAEDEKKNALKENLWTATDNGGDYKSAIKSLYESGMDGSTIKGAITDHYKPMLIEMKVNNSSEFIKMKNRVIAIRAEADSRTGFKGNGKKSYLEYETNVVNKWFE